jgi:hypothetical protein
VTGKRPGVIRSAAESELASRQPSRQPLRQASSSYGWIEATRAHGVSACWAHVLCLTSSMQSRSTFVPGTRRSSRCCMFRGSVVYVPVLCLSGFCVGIGGRASRDGTVLLAGVQRAQTESHYANHTAAVGSPPISTRDTDLAATVGGRDGLHRKDIESGGRRRHRWLQLYAV